MRVETLPVPSSSDFSHVGSTSTPADPRQLCTPDGVRKHLAGLEEVTVSIGWLICVRSACNRARSVALVFAGACVSRSNLRPGREVLVSSFHVPISTRRAHHTYRGECVGRSAADAVLTP
eukprot:scaffold827_cov369-Prasinococcus_capsulatus_cf.AAC.9